VGATRDLGRVEFWQESLERSLARRGKLHRSSLELYRLRPERDLGASVTPERIDQGVDYSGSGTLSAIGAATVVYVGLTGTGWPGAFIEYQLLDGPDAGRYVYYAEGVSPAGGLHVGQTLTAGQPVADIIPGWSSGIEIGWGAGIGTETYAAANNEWTPTMDANNVPTPAGESFSSLVASLGGPPGIVEG
jgi:hypothetical protein